MAARPSDVPEAVGSRRERQRRGQARRFELLYRWLFWLTALVILADLVSGGRPLTHWIHWPLSR